MTPPDGQSVSVAVADLRLLLDLAFDIEHRSMDEVEAMRRMLVAIGHPEREAIDTAMHGLTEITETWTVTS